MASAFFRTIIMATLPINAKTNSVDANEKTATKETDKQDAQYNKSNSMPQLRKTNQTESVSRTARFSVWAPMENARLLCRDRCHLRRRRFAMVICLLKTMHIQPFLSTSTKTAKVRALIWLILCIERDVCYTARKKHPLGYSHISKIASKTTL